MKNILRNLIIGVVLAASISALCIGIVGTMEEFMNFDDTPASVLHVV